MKSTYYNPSDPGGFSSAENLYRSVKKHVKGVTLKEVSEWLLGQNAFTRHRRVVRRFPRRRVIRLGKLDTMGVDLIDAISLSPQNSGAKYIFVLCDIFCLKVWLRSLKDKTAKSTEEAFRSCFDEIGETCKSIWGDSGSEFKLKPFYDEIGAHFYSVKSPLHNCIVERLNKTIENKIFAICTARNTLRYVDFLQDVALAINNRPSRALFGETPNTIWNSVKKQIWLRKKFSELENATPKKPRFKVGQYVRTALPHNKFTRGYHAGFSEEPKKIVEILKFNVPTYKLEGSTRSWYESELSPVLKVEKEGHDPAREYFFIEKTRQVAGETLRSGRARSKDTEYLLKNLNDSSVHRWLSEEEYLSMKKKGLLAEK